MMHRITLYTRHRWADRPPAFHRNMTKRCNDIDLGIVVCRASGELIGNSKDFIAMVTIKKIEVRWGET